MRALGRILLWMALVALALVAMSLAWSRHSAMSEEEARARYRREGREMAPVSVRRTGSMPEILGESSGVAVSRVHGGVLWTHNDAGGLPRLFAITPEGTILGVFVVEVPGATDWEDVSLGPCPETWRRGTTNCLYVADTGDNERRRSSYSVVVVQEPDPRRSSEEGTISVPARRIVLRYADGPHDVEALMVGPEGDLTLLTKGRSGRIQVFGVKAAAVVRGIETGTATVAEEVGVLAIEPRGVLGRMVTGAAISPSGTRAVVRTYGELYFYRRDPEGGLEREGNPCFLGELEPQGEAVDFLDEESVIVTSEISWGREGGIHEVRCR